MLKDELSQLNSKQKKFFHLLIAGVKRDTALAIAGIPKATFKYWQGNDPFRSLLDRVETLKDNYFDEAFQILRHDNKVIALFLEQMLLEKIKEEIESGEYNLVKTPLAKDVYNKALEEGKGVNIPSVGWLQFVASQQVIAQPQLTAGKELPAGVSVEKNKELPAKESQ